MTATTGVPHYLTYPTSGDSVANLDDIVEILARQVHARLPITGTVVITIPNGDDFATGAIEFPAGLFSAAPQIVPTVRGNRQFIASVSTGPAPTAAGATLNAYRPAGAVSGAVNVTVDWIAVRKSS